MFEAIGEAVGAIRAGIDALLEVDFTMLDRQELLDVLRDLERQARRLPAVDHRAVAEVDERNLAGELACTNTAALLGGLLRISPAEARTRLRDYRELGPRRELTGAPLPPLFPSVAAAQAAGEISSEHAHVITRMRRVLPDMVDKEHGEAIEATLVEHAAHLDPAQLGVAARRARGLLDPDGTAGDERDHQRRRCFRIRRNEDGSGDLSGRLTPSALAVWETIIGALSAPVPAEDGTPDLRTPEQRRHDAFLDAGKRLLRSGTLPDCNGGPPADEGVAGGGGTPVTVLVRINLDDLRSQTGYADTEYDGLISAAELLRLAAEADIVPVVCNDAGGVLAYGRTRRIATPAQRRALALRDGGCSFPQCTAPASWTEAHHITPWIDDGLTDIDTLTLLCGYHHREHERLGWTCQTINGIPHWTPPAWLDPDQIPRRNTAHHIDIHFNTAS